MKLIHVLWSGRMGGAEKALVQLVKAQQDHVGLRPTVGLAQAEGENVERLRKLGCPVIDLGLKDSGQVTAVGRVRSQLNGFDLHHFHGAEPTIMLASSGCRSACRVYTHRGASPPSGLRRKARSWMVGWMLRHRFHAMSGNTAHAARIGARQFGVPQDRWSVTYNGLDFSMLTPKESRETIVARHNIPSGKRLMIGTSGNLRVLKRVDLLVKAMTYLAPKGGHLIIVGEGPDRSRLESMARDLGVASSVTFTGRQSDIGSYLSVLDVFVLPSNSEESFGNSLVEAMGMGLPGIVFRDGGGLVEHVDNGSNGYVVQSVEELEQRLGSLAERDPERKQMGERARTSIRSKYTLERMAQSYLELYNRATGKKDSSTRGPA